MQFIEAEFFRVNILIISVVSPYVSFHFKSRYENLTAYEESSLSLLIEMHLGIFGNCTISVDRAGHKSQSTHTHTCLQYGVQQLYVHFYVLKCACVQGIGVCACIYVYYLNIFYLLNVLFKYIHTEIHSHTYAHIYVVAFFLTLIKTIAVAAAALLLFDLCVAFVVVTNASALPPPQQLLLLLLAWGTFGTLCTNTHTHINWYIHMYA